MIGTEQKPIACEQAKALPRMVLGAISLR